MQVEDVVDGIIQQAQQKQKSTATTAQQRKAARLRQVKCRENKLQRTENSIADQLREEQWRERRDSLRVTNLFETAPGVLCTDFQQQFHIARVFARKLIVKPLPDETYRTFCRRTLEKWTGSHIRAAGMNLATESWVWSVRFGYARADANMLAELLQEMLVGCPDPDAAIPTDLEPLPWRCLPARPVQPVDEKVQRAHEGHDQQVRDERCIASGKFSIIDDGNAFLIKPDCSETGWRFPRTFPSAQIHVHWNLLALAHQYLQNNPNDERFCPDVCARIARVYEFRLQSTKTNFARGMQEE